MTRFFLILVVTVRVAALIQVLSIPGSVVAAMPAPRERRFPLFGEGRGIDQGPPPPNISLHTPTIAAGVLGRPEEDKHINPAPDFSVDVRPSGAAAGPGSPRERTRFEKWRRFRKTSAPDTKS
jgi:hypothetical protein